jgi:hypothetical protein
MTLTSGGGGDAAGFAAALPRSPARSTATAAAAAPIDTHEARFMMTVIYLLMTHIMYNVKRVIVEVRR